MLTFILGTVILALTYRAFRQNQPARDHAYEIDCRGAIVNTASILDVVAEPGVPRTGYAFLTYSGNLREHGCALGC